MLLAWILAISLQPLPAQRPSPRSFIYLVHVGDRWCSYLDESEQQAEVARANALDVAVVHFTAHGMDRIAVTEETESGDWIVYDQYSIGADGQPVALLREVRIAEGGRVRQSFRIKAGRAVLVRHIEVNPRTGKETKGPLKKWLPDIPVATTLSSLDFQPLLLDARARTASGLCLPGRAHSR